MSLLCANRHLHLRCLRNSFKETGTTENDYLYTGEQYNEATGLYYLRARYMNPETGTFISMDSYAGSLDNPVSLHKYLYANANPVMYTDPTGYFSLSESSVAQACRSMLDKANITPLKILHKTMQWANMVVTVYDTWEMCEKLQSGESTVMDVAFVIMGGILINGLLQCWVGSETATIILKAVNAKMSSNSLKEAIKSRDPEKIMIEVLRFMVALYSFHCECFTGETLVSTTEGDKRIDEIEVGDFVYAYDTETEETVPARVTYVSVTETNILVHIYTSEGEEIKTTMLHPFYVKNVKNGKEEYRVWKASANLVVGDELLTEDGRVVYVKEVKVERLEESIKVYNLEVEGLHTYYVGSGILVHNQYGKKDTGNSNESDSNTKLFKDQSLLEKHFEKHGQEIADVLDDSNYTIDKYLDDANYIIKNGTYTSELNGYVSFMSGKKFGFVGLDRTTGDITTFHIKNISELIKKAPSLGFEK